MTQPHALKDRPASTENEAVKPTDEQIKNESSVQYRRSIDKINRSQDRDIERALRR